MLVKITQGKISFSFEMNQSDFRFLWFYNIVEFSLRILTRITSLFTKEWTDEYKKKWGYKVE